MVWSWCGLDGMNPQMLSLSRWPAVELQRKRFSDLSSVMDESSDGSCVVLIDFSLCFYSSSHVTSNDVNITQDLQTPHATRTTCKITRGKVFLFFFYRDWENLSLDSLNFLFFFWKMSKIVLSKTLTDTVFSFRSAVLLNANAAAAGECLWSH